MDLSNVLAIDERQETYRFIPTERMGEVGAAHAHPSRHTHWSGTPVVERLTTPPAHKMLSNATRSPSTGVPKNISFELHFDGSPNVRGRLPMRVQIFPHDTTDSIVTTVKNFYGLYDSGVSFEDANGNVLIASFDNLTNNMTVFVRIGADLPQPMDHAEAWGYRQTSPQRMQSASDVTPMLPPQPAQVLNYGQPPSRPGSRVSRKQSISPKLAQGRICSATKSRSRSGAKSQGSSFQAGLDELNSNTQNEYNSSDGGDGASVTSSRKARSEQLATADISVDNIVEGGRRQRAKFESSELPLFVPPQVPAPNSISSVSPQRRSNAIDHPSPFARPLQNTFSFQTTEQPQSSFTANPQVAPVPPTASPFTVPAAPNHGHRLRERTSGASVTRSSLGSGGRFSGSNILPTPDPTVASCISDEDVALQLMRLGDASNFSHGRTSASTLDDAFSGRAEAASSATSNVEYSADESDASIRPHVKEEPGTDLLGPPLKKQRRSFEETYSGDDYAGDYDRAGKIKIAQKPKKPRPSALSMKGSRPIKSQGSFKKSKSMPTATTFHQPISPASLPPSRKTSASTINFQHGINGDEDDLSSKPRCQRCRKSKKGCDRQRPCSRCKDAGIGAEGCVSEDEGNGRKGRYGRHMGVPVSTVPDASSLDNGPDMSPITPMPIAMDIGDSKKRKR